MKLLEKQHAKIRNLCCPDVICIFAKYILFINSTFNEGMYLVSAHAQMDVQTPFEETKDIGFYHRPETALVTLIPQNSWKFVPAGVYHGPLYGGFKTESENVLPDGEKLQVVKICIKILAD